MQRSEPAAAVILIHTITLHFLGNPKEEQAAAKSVLSLIWDAQRSPIIDDTKMYF